MAADPSLQPFLNSQMDHFGFQGTEKLESKPEPVESPATLLIRHLPEAIPQETLSRLFSHYGASSVRPCSSGRLRNCAFVGFKNDILAYQAQRQLHGLRFLGKVLSVERSSKVVENSDKQSEAKLLKDSKIPASVVTDANMLKALSEGPKSGSLPSSEPIAPRLGVDYPFPPDLEYAYPPPDGNILTNIVNALIAVPRFYTQVLHLMNKMNIPAPFRMALPTPPLPPSVPAPPPPPPPPPSSIAAKPQFTDLSSDESEMASSDEEVDKDAYAVAATKVAKSGQKRARREAIVGPAIDKDVAHEAVGLKLATLLPKEMPVIRKRNPVLQIKITQKEVQNENEGDKVMKELEELDKDVPDPKTFFTPEELQSGKLPPEEILSLPMFKCTCTSLAAYNLASCAGFILELTSICSLKLKDDIVTSCHARNFSLKILWVLQNYTAGNPTSVLYIKNLAKDVINEDFYFIFGSFFGSMDAAKSGLHVKLMQEGRMRGQAFVTFPSIELAHHALNLANGYVFKGKPLIIQFGRNPVASKAT